jgi:Fur family peroxide stress response transcriptional regulator
MTQTSEVSTQANGKGKPVHMDDKDDQTARFTEMCKKHQLRVTPQRFAIYREISASKDHPSADMVFQAVRKDYRNISFDTVYRTLVTFKEIGLIDVVEGQGGPKRFDSNMGVHHHFYCLKCNTIVDFYCDDYDRLIIPAEIREKYTVLSKRVILNGLCNRCDLKK